MTDDELKKQQLSAYFSELGKKAGAKNKAKGSAYFKWVRSKGKVRPVKKQPEEAEQKT